MILTSVPSSPLANSLIAGAIPLIIEGGPPRVREGEAVSGVVGVEKLHFALFLGVLSHLNTQFVLLDERAAVRGVGLGKRIQEGIGRQLLRYLRVCRE